MLFFFGDVDSVNITLLPLIKRERLLVFEKAIILTASSNSLELALFDNMEMDAVRRTNYAIRTQMVLEGSDVTLVNEV